MAESGNKSFLSNSKKRTAESLSNDNNPKKRRRLNNQRNNIKPDAAIIKELHGPKPDNHNKNWSKEDDKILLKYAAGGKTTMDELMKILKRKRRAIEARLRTLKSKKSNKNSSKPKFRYRSVDCPQIKKDLMSGKPIHCPYDGKRFTDYGVWKIHWNKLHDADHGPVWKRIQRKIDHRYKQIKKQSQELSQSSQDNRNKNQNHNASTSKEEDDHDHNTASNTNSKADVYVTPGGPDSGDDIDEADVEVWFEKIEDENSRKQAALIWLFKLLMYFNEEKEAGGTNKNNQDQDDKKVDIESDMGELNRTIERLQSGEKCDDVLDQESILKYGELYQRLESIYGEWVNDHELNRYRLRKESELRKANKKKSNQDIKESTNTNNNSNSNNNNCVDSKEEKEDNKEKENKDKVETESVDQDCDLFLVNLKEYLNQENKSAEYMECDRILMKIEKYKRKYGAVKRDENGKYYVENKAVEYKDSK